MSAIDKVKAHFHKGLQSFEVPEWDLTIWSYPVSVEKQLAIRAMAKTPDGLRSSVATIVIMALDEKGERLFKDEDLEPMVQEADRDVVLSVADKLLRLGVTQEAIEKKS